jgi:hypothetical protein
LAKNQQQPGVEQDKAMSGYREPFDPYAAAAPPAQTTVAGVSNSLIFGAAADEWDDGLLDQDDGGGGGGGGGNFLPPASSQGTLGGLRANANANGAVAAPSFTEQHDNEPLSFYQEAAAASGGATAARLAAEQQRQRQGATSASASGAPRLDNRFDSFDDGHLARQGPAPAASFLPPFVENDAAAAAASTESYLDDEDDMPSSAAEMHAGTPSRSHGDANDARGGRSGEYQDGNGDDEDEEPPPPPPPPPEPVRYDGDEVVGAIRRAFLAALPRQHPPRTLRYDAEYPYWRQEVRRFGELPGLLNAIRAALDDAAACPPGDAPLFERATADAAMPSVLIWAALDTFTDSWQYEEQFLALDGVDTLLRALAVFCTEPAVTGPIVGAALSLAARSQLGRAELDALGAVRGIRAAMVAQPQLDYGGVFKDLKPWLDQQAGGGGDDVRSERIIAQRVAVAREAAREANGAGGGGGSGGQTTGGGLDDAAAQSPQGARSPTPSSPGAGAASPFSSTPFSSRRGLAGGGENSPGATNGATPGATPPPPGTSVDLSSVGGVWFAFQQHQESLLVPTRVCKIRRLTFNPAAAFMRGHSQPAHLWVTADYTKLCYSYGPQRADGGVPRGERRMELRDLLEVRRGISTQSLLQHAPRGSAGRCLAIRFSSKTVNVVFETPGEMEVWAAALGALGAHVTSLIGTNGVNAQARTALATSLAGVNGGVSGGGAGVEEEFPRAVAAAEFELDKALAHGACGCAVRCGGRFCRQQLKQVEKVAAERRATTSKIALSRRLYAEKKRAETLLTDLQKFRTARDQEELMVARAAASWRAKTAASAASAAENQAEDELKATQERVSAIREKIKTTTRSLRFTGLVASLGATAAQRRLNNGEMGPAELGEDDVLPDEMPSTAAHRIVAAVESDDYDVALAALRELAAKTEHKKASHARRVLAAEGAVTAVVDLLGAAADDGGKVGAAAARCCAHLARDKPNAVAMLRMGALPVLLTRLRDFVAAAEAAAEALAADAKLAGKEAERAALGAANVGVDDDTTDESPGQFRQYSTRDARAAAAAAEKASEAARAPLTPPVGTFEASSLVVNLCAGAEGVLARVEALESGAMLDLAKLLAVLCRNGGKPAPDDEGRDVVKPVCMLLRSLSLDAVGLCTLNQVDP